MRLFGSGQSTRRGWPFRTSTRAVVCVASAAQPRTAIRHASVFCHVPGLPKLPFHQQRRCSVRTSSGADSTLVYDQVLRRYSQVGLSLQRDACLDDNQRREAVDNSIHGLATSLAQLYLKGSALVTPTKSARSDAKRSNPELSTTHTTVDSIRLKNRLLLHLNEVVELRDQLGPLSVRFLRIKEILLHNVSGGVVVRGLPYARTVNLNGLRPGSNEVCLIYQTRDGDSRTIDQQALVEVSSDLIVRKRSVKITNKVFPSGREELGHSANSNLARQAPLICRWKLFLRYPSQKHPKRTVREKPYEYAFAHMTGEDVETPGDGIPDEMNLSIWRGGKVRGGSYLPQNTGEYQPYTIGDCFAGGGGALSGASQAGLRLEFAVEYDEACNETLRLNFKDIKLYEMDIHEWLADPLIKHRSDILHVSPPCQAFSPANTRGGRNDAANIEALHTVPRIIEKIRPRILTLEQTLGLFLIPRHQRHLHKLVEGLTNRGYSVRWKLVHLPTWGLPQTRTRLIFISSCPGEKLPPFPDATHGNDPASGLPPFVTSGQALEGLRFGQGDDMHVLLSSKERKPLKYGPADILPRAITCGGGQGNWHWDGRDFTLREFARLQTFPDGHLFTGRRVKKQIGNAVPPVAGKVLFQHARKWLEKQDGIVHPPLLMACLLVVLDCQPVIHESGPSGVRHDIHHAETLPSQDTEHQPEISAELLARRERDALRNLPVSAYFLKYPRGV